MHEISLSSASWSRGDGESRSFLPRILLSFTTKTRNFDALVNAGYRWAPGWTASTLALVFLVGASGRGETAQIPGSLIGHPEKLTSGNEWCC
jgi:hypothetical protein